MLLYFYIHCKRMNITTENNGNIIRPCYGVHDCRKFFMEQQNISKKEPLTYTPCTNGCSTDLGNLTLPIHVTASFLTVRKYDWKLTSNGGYNHSKCRVQWDIDVIRKDLNRKNGTFSVYGSMGVKNTGKEASDLGNMVILLQTLERKHCKEKWVTKYAAVQSVFETNGKEVGNVVPGVSEEDSYTNSNNAKLTVTNADMNDIFSIPENFVRQVRGNSFKYYNFEANFIVPVTFDKETRVVVLMTFGNASDNCDVFHGNQVAYKGGDILYNNVATIRYEAVQGLTPLEYTNTKSILQTSLQDTDVIKGTGSFNNFTTDIGFETGNIGTEELSDSTKRSICLNPNPVFLKEDRVFQNTTMLSIQCDSVFFNLPIEPEITNKTIRFTFVGSDGGLSKSITTDVYVTNPCMKKEHINEQKSFTIYSATDFADNEDGCFDRAWSVLGSELTLKSVNGGGFKIKFTDSEAVKSNLRLISTESGRIQYDMNNPYSTEAGSSLASIMWLDLLFALLPKVESYTIDSSLLSLYINPSNMSSGVEQQLFAFNGLSIRNFNDVQTMFVVSDIPSGEALIKSRSSVLPNNLYNNSDGIKVLGNVITYMIRR